MKKKEKMPPMLDYWTAPKLQAQSGEAVTATPIGFVCSSFTFDADFFDDECLTRFLCMETEKENDGAAFLVEREEKLAGLNGGIVLVDQHHCKGSRSLRWDLVPCRIKNGILHAKITLLHWSNCIRLIVGSANLTANGYCINQEIFGVFDYHEGSEEDLKLITEMLEFLNDITQTQCGAVTRERFEKLEGEMRMALKNWKIRNKEYYKDEIWVRPLLVAPLKKNGLDRLREIWDERSSSPPCSVFVTSPFFDEKESAHTPSVVLPHILKQRGGIDITYQMTTESVSANDNRLIVLGPSFLQNSPKSNCEVNFIRIEQTGRNEDEKEVPRPLHMKTIWLQNEYDDLHVMMAGSSNFTSAALGLGKYVNYEANLVYSVSRKWDATAFQQLAAAHLDGDGLDKKKLVFKEIINQDEPLPDAGEVLLPSFFGEAIISKADQHLVLELNFTSQYPPQGFEIMFEKNPECIMVVNEVAWVEAGKQMKIELQWTEQFIPDHLLVKWIEAKDFAFWPVIAENQLTLPPVEQLRNLPLEALLYILSSTQPLHRLLKKIEEIKTRKKQETENGNVPVVDAHKLVDTSGFLLQRTRKVSYAMRALAARLEKPVFTQDSLRWRLHGPIGVQSLIDAVNREAKTPGEKNFLLAELALELSRLNPKETEVSLKAHEVRDRIKEFVRVLQTEIKDKEAVDDEILKYSTKAVKKALNEF